MPQLPSGLKLALLIDHIMEPDRNWFRAPEGHFWLWVPAPEFTPPFAPSEEWENSPDTAPVPSSREEAKKYIRVGIGLDNGNFYWRGEMLSEFPKYDEFSEDDRIAWHEWLETQPVQEFLDSAIEKCTEQAEVNKNASGHAVISGVKTNEDGSQAGVKIIDHPPRVNAD